MRLKRRLESDLKVTSRGFAWQPELSEPVGQAWALAPPEFKNWSESIGWAKL